MKRKYSIVALYGASKYLGTVEAESAEEAKAKGEEMETYVSLCHQCAGEIDLGDCYDIVAEAEDGEEDKP